MSEQHFIEQQLTQIEQYLKQARMWSDHAPGNAAMASEVPFAADAMAFEQWLQFKFLPQMRHYNQQRGDVPSNMAVAPMAHQMLGPNHTRLIHLLLSLDNLSEKQHG